MESKFKSELLGISDAACARAVMRARVAKIMVGVGVVGSLGVFAWTWKESERESMEFADKKQKLHAETFSKLYVDQGAQIQAQMASTHKN